MKTARRGNRKISASKAAAGIVLAVAVLVIAQNLSLNLSEIPFALGVPGAVCNVLAGILYIVFTYMGVKLISRKFLKISMDEMRIPRININARWLTAAVVMPVSVLIISILTGGYWEISFPDLETTLSTITGGVAFYGLGAGITEELVFRGVIMGCLEQRTNKYVAVLVPSVLFGMLHLIGNDLDIISAVQVVAAGSVVGILFSLITYENGSIWNSAVVHAVWNMVFVSGVLHIGSSADSSSICSFVLENKSFLISGGDFGIEASVISVMVYLAFCVMAGVCVKKIRNSSVRPISDW